MCQICGKNPGKRMWFLEPKDSERNDFIMVCDYCHQDLVMIRRWRRLGR